MTDAAKQREEWVEKALRDLFLAGSAWDMRKPRHVAIIQAYLKEAMAVADAHPMGMEDSESLEQPSPLRVVPSIASDGTAPAATAKDTEEGSR